MCAYGSAFCVLSEWKSRFLMVQTRIPYDLYCSLVRTSDYGGGNHMTTTLDILKTHTLCTYVCVCILNKTPYHTCQQRSTVQKMLLLWLYTTHQQRIALSAFPFFLILSLLHSLTGMVINTLLCLPSITIASKKHTHTFNRQLVVSIRATITSNLYSSRKTGNTDTQTHLHHSYYFSIKLHLTEIIIALHFIAVLCMYIGDFSC